MLVFNLVTKIVCKKKLNFLKLVFSQITWENNVDDMERENPIKNSELLLHTSIVLGAVVMMFFIHSVPSIHLDLGWIAVLGLFCRLIDWLVGWLVGWCCC